MEERERLERNNHFFRGDASPLSIQARLDVVESLAHDELVLARQHSGLPRGPGQEIFVAQICEKLAMIFVISFIAEFPARWVQLLLTIKNESYFLKAR